MLKAFFGPLAKLTEAALLSGQDGKGLGFGGWGKKLTSWVDNGSSGPKSPGM
ncbi:MAG: hypothetical protein WBK55_06245 [Alphaproteobacteria bacterium]